MPPLSEAAARKVLVDLFRKRTLALEDPTDPAARQTLASSLTSAHVTAIRNSINKIIGGEPRKHSERHPIVGRNASGQAFRTLTKKCNIDTVDLAIALGEACTAQHTLTTLRKIVTAGLSCDFDEIYRRIYNAQQQQSAGTAAVLFGKTLIESVYQQWLEEAEDDSDTEKGAEPGEKENLAEEETSVEEDSLLARSSPVEEESDNVSDEEEHNEVERESPAEDVEVEETQDSLFQHSEDIGNNDDGTSVLPNSEIDQQTQGEQGSDTTQPASDTAEFEEIPLPYHDPPRKLSDDCTDDPSPSSSSDCIQDASTTTTSNLHREASPTDNMYTFSTVQPQQRKRIRADDSDDESRKRALALPSPDSISLNDAKQLIMNYFVPTSLPVSLLEDDGLLAETGNFKRLNPKVDPAGAQMVIYFGRSYKDKPQLPDGSCAIVNHMLHTLTFFVPDGLDGATDKRYDEVARQVSAAITAVGLPKSYVDYSERETSALGGLPTDADDIAKVQQLAIVAMCAHIAHALHKVHAPLPYALDLYGRWLLALRAMPSSLKTELPQVPVAPPATLTDFQQRLALLASRLESGKHTLASIDGFRAVVAGSLADISLLKNISGAIQEAAFAGPSNQAMLREQERVVTKKHQALSQLLLVLVLDEHEVKKWIKDIEWARLTSASADADAGSVEAKRHILKC